MFFKTVRKQFIDFWSPLDWRQGWIWRDVLSDVLILDACRLSFGIEFGVMS